jgi:hypothetical protein
VEAVFDEVVLEMRQEMAAYRELMRQKGHARFGA